MDLMPRLPAVFAAVLISATLSPQPALASVPRLSDVRTSSSVFSPDGDGVRDYVVIAYRLNAPALTTVRIYRANRVVRTLRLRSFSKAGRRTARWNGLDGRGARAPNADYEIRVAARWNTGAMLARRRVTLRASRLRWVGFAVPGVPYESMDPLTQLEAQVGRRARIVNLHQAQVYQFDPMWTQRVREHGATLMLTLEFWRPGKGPNQPEFSLKRISGGAYDGYLREYADRAAAVGDTLWLRPLHEMNGRWYPWGGMVNGNTPADFAPAWRHIRSIFLSRGATNVKFVWSPNHESVPITPENAISVYWPGDDQVDLVALDGYNWGTSQSWSRWKTFGELFGRAYGEVTRLTGKPLIIGETGSSDVGGDKAAWIARMFGSVPTTYPRISGICWFNKASEQDWRLNSDPASLEAFQAGAAAF